MNFVSSRKIFIMSASKELAVLLQNNKYLLPSIEKFASLTKLFSLIKKIYKEVMTNASTNFFTIF
jgi:hypothetical protein